jgi:RNA polymerase sigma-70 factor (ECF subfamily)
MDRDRENRIIERIVSGDRQAFAYLVDKYKGPVYNLVYRMTGHHQETEDLAQEIFIRAYGSLDKFDTNRNFFPWLYTLALNVLRNHLKKRSPILIDGERNNYQNRNVADSHNPETIVNQMEETRRLAQTIEKLPFPQREAVVLRYYQDLAFEDIAEILDISLSAAKMRVYRGLEKLAGRLKKEDKR